MILANGTAYRDISTKMLIHKLAWDSIAVIKHPSIDLVAAQELYYKKIKCVINCEKTLSEKNSLSGVKYLLDRGIFIFDIKSVKFFNMVRDGDNILIDDSCRVFINGHFYTLCTPVSRWDLSNVFDNNHNGDYARKYYFVKNTMVYMSDELNYFIRERELPEMNTCMKGRNVLIVARGRDYREDLKSVKNFIIRKKPVIIGVDGGANAVFDTGLKCDMIIGDMDSVSDNSLNKADEIIVQTYSNGYAPGLERIKKLKLDYKLLKIKGTSEDAAIYVAKAKGASCIYLIGGHSGYEEFLEKGRSGMGSTALLRMLYGDKIIDLKGVSTVTQYNQNHFSTALILLTVLLFAALMLFEYGNVLGYFEAFLKTFFNAR